MIEILKLSVLQAEELNEEIDKSIELIKSRLGTEFEIKKAYFMSKLVSEPNNIKYLDYTVGVLDGERDITVIDFKPYSETEYFKILSQINSEAKSQYN